MPTHLFVEKICAAQKPEHSRSARLETIGNIRRERREPGSRTLAGCDVGLRIVPHGIDAETQRAASQRGLDAEAEAAVQAITDQILAQMK